MTKVKKRAKRLFCLLLSVIMLTGMMAGIDLTALAETSGDFEYEVTSSANGISLEVSITGYHGSATNLTIPSELDGAEVVTIGQDAFQNNSMLQSVVIPDTVMSIGNYAFYSCESLTSVIIPDSVTNIGDYAFEFCANLTEITIPDSVTSIGGAILGNTPIYKNPDNWENGAFYYSDCLLETTDDKLYDYDSEGYYDESNDWVYPLISDAVPAEVFVRPGTRLIARYAFSWNNTVKSVTVPDSVVYIGDAFTYCEALESVSLGNGVKNVPSFEGCTALKSFSVGNSAESWPYDAFGDCTLLESIDIGDGATGFAVSGDVSNLGITDSVFYNNPDNWVDSALYIGKHLMEIQNKDSVSGSFSVREGTVSIANKAFSGCENLTAISLPESVTRIGDYAFEDCYSLTEITIPQSVTNIGDSAFVGCDSLISISIPKSVKKIGSYAFDSCYQLDQIELPEGLNELGDGAFEYCYKLKSITLPASLQKIESDTFSGCASLTAVTIPNGISEIGYGAFLGCTALRKITIPGSVQTVGEYAFQKCTALESIVLEHGVQTVENYAFSVCPSLTEVSLPDSLTTFGYHVFWQDTALTQLTIPAAVTEMGENIAIECTALESIDVAAGNATFASEDGVLFNKAKTTLLSFPAGKKDSTYSVPDGVKEIAPVAFGYNRFLTEVCIPDSVTTIGDGAFQCCTSLETAAVPDSVTTLGSSAFYNCTNLKTVTLGNSISEIADGLFDGCSSLTGITIPDSATAIGDYAFRACTALTSVTVGSGVSEISEHAFFDGYSDDSAPISEMQVSDANPAYCCVDSVLYTKDMTELVYYPVTKKAAAYTLPATVTAVCYSIRQNPYLETITVPSENTAYCSEDGVLLTKDKTEIICYPIGKPDVAYTVPDPVAFIYSNVFENNTALREITLGKEFGATDYVNQVEFFAPNLEAVYVSQENPYYVSENGILYSSDMTELVKYPCAKADVSYVLPESVTDINDYAFDGCKNLKSITLNTVMLHDDYERSSNLYALNNITSLESILVPDENPNLQSLDDVLFTKDGKTLICYPCSKAGEYTVPNGVEVIDYTAFQGAAYLTAVTIPDTVKEINGCFRNCPNLRSVTLPDNGMYIDDFSFSDCVALEAVTIPSSVKFSWWQTFGHAYDSDLDWFAPLPYFTVYGEPGSNAESYALHEGFKFVAGTYLNSGDTNISAAGGTGVVPQEAALQTECIETAENRVVYEISLVKDGEEIQPNGAVTVKIPVPSGMDGAACKVYRAETDGSYTDMHAVLQDGYLVFTTDHFSEYVVTTGEPDVPAAALGDVDGNGVVNAADAVMVLRSDAGLITLTAEQAAAADVSGDGIVNASDAVQILRYDAGLITQF